MNIADSLAGSYVQEFWPEKPEPMKQMMRIAYTAGYNGFRGQVAAMAMQLLLANNIIIQKPMLDKGYIAKSSVEVADALISELNKKR